MHILYVMHSNILILFHTELLTFGLVAMTLLVKEGLSGVTTINQ